MSQFYQCDRCDLCSGQGKCAKSGGASGPWVRLSVDMHLGTGEFLYDLCPKCAAELDIFLGLYRQARAADGALTKEAHRVD